MEGSLMKNYTLTLVLAVLVVLTSVMLRKSLEGATPLSSQGSTLVAMGPARVPLPPSHVAAIGVRWRSQSGVSGHPAGLALNRTQTVPDVSRYLWRATFVQ